jgi:DNA polymerase
MKTLHVDVETRSRADLRVVGTDAYARHPSTELLMVAWAVDDGPICQWTMYDTDDDLGDTLGDLCDLLRDPTVLKVAHNAVFERAIFRHLIQCDTPIEQWRCTMVNAFMLALPGGLEDLGKVIKVPDEFQKLDTGKHLINTFSKPRTGKKTRGTFFTPQERPEDWAKFCLYNRQDVEAERYIYKHRLSKYPLADNEWDQWFTDQRINERGVPIDRTFVANAKKMVDDEMTELRSQMGALTGLENPNSDKQFGPWVRERGYNFSSLNKASVAKAMATGDLDETARVALRLRAQLKRTSCAKYETALEALPEDDRLRFMFQFSGAKRTGRWAGRLVQFQNLAKPSKDIEPRLEDIVESVRDNDAEWLKIGYGNVMGALSGTIRAIMRARPGHRLLVCDLNAIEVRVIGWITNCQPLLDVFRQGRDPYKVFGVEFYRKEYELITKAERNFSKPPMLGCGFRLGPGQETIDDETGEITYTGLRGYAETLGVKMSLEEAKRAVEIYRNMYPEIAGHLNPDTGYREGGFWLELENTVKDVIRDGRKRQLGLLEIDRLDPFLRIRLPSGRRLHYLRPKLEMKMTPYGKEKLSITFEGEEDDGTRRFWGRVTTHGGKLTENIVQAVANDLLRVGMENADAADFEIVLHAHDELVAEVPDESRLGLARLRECMINAPPWAEGLPLDAAGFETIFYRKD